MPAQACWCYGCKAEATETRISNPNSLYRGADLHCCPEHALSIDVTRSHKVERTTGEYKGPQGSFWRIVDPKDPTCYYGWASRREDAAWYAKNPEHPSSVVVERASQLTLYEAGFSDLSEPVPPMPATERWAIIDYCAEHKIPTIHASE